MIAGQKIPSNLGEGLWSKVLFEYRGVWYEGVVRTKLKVRGILSIRIPTRPHQLAT